MAVPKQKTSSVCQMENEIKSLKEENKHLKMELEEIRSLYKQLVHEAPSEKFDEMRVNLLKSQLIQLERQILLQSEAITSRADILLVVENALQSTADSMRNLLASGVYGPTVPVERSQLMKVIENLEGARHRLYKNIENNSSEKLAKPVLYMGEFLKPGRGREVTVLDVCNGTTEHISLKHVAKLESKLFTLQKNLHALHQSMKLFWSHDFKQPVYTNQQLGLPVIQRLSGQLAKSEKCLEQCCRDLIALSILVPTAPWPVLNKPPVVEVTTEMVLSALPNFPRSKQQEGKKMITALTKACSYTRQVVRLEAKACAEELKYHQAIYQLQMDYMQSLFTAVSDAYCKFEGNIQQMLGKPLKDVLDSFMLLRDSASEDALRDFLATFKDHADTLTDAVKSLSPCSDNVSDGTHKALTDFGKQFFISVDTQSRKCIAERDRLAKEIEEVKQQRELYNSEVKDIFSPKPEVEKVDNGTIEENKHISDISHECGDVSVKNVPVRVSSAKKTLNGPKSSNDVKGSGMKQGLIEGKATVRNAHDRGNGTIDEQVAIAPVTQIPTSRPKMVRQNSSGGTPSRIARPTSSLQRGLKKSPTK
ncbi:uncharacterized protein LOC117120286 [Anneissia japonica]|uniref:uncharacterized protein LOC117120286 n=1 Tax=Anneissia japonica TaxID=1529436 RepID=UPI0014255B40|nr:uncharacterized protein LOC117120286 [Anneissia japonica]